MVKIILAIVFVSLWLMISLISGLISKNIQNSIDTEIDKSRFKNLKILQFSLEGPFVFLRLKNNK